MIFPQFRTFKSSLILSVVDCKFFSSGYSRYTFQIYIIEHEGRETEEVRMGKSDLGRQIKI